MTVSPQQLEEAFRKVQRGEFAPDEAARWLLRPAAVPAQPGAISIAQLLESLGPPPISIQQDWNRQLDQLTAQFEQANGCGLPDLTTADIFVDDDNRLTLAPHLTSAGPKPMVPDSLPLPDQLVVNPATQAQHQSQARAAVEPLRTRPRWLVPSLTIAAGSIAVAIGYACLPATRIEPVSQDISQDKTRQTRSSPVETSSAARTSLPAQASDISPDKRAGAAATAPPPAKPRGMLGLDSFAGGDWISGNELLAGGEPTTSFETTQPTIDQDADDSVDIAQPTAQPGTAAAGGSPDLSESETVDSPTTELAASNSVSLPPLRSAKSSPEETPGSPILDHPVKSLALLFSGDSPLTLMPSDDGQNWLVNDATAAQPIAAFSTNANQLSFRWLEASARHPAQLASAALRFTHPDGTSDVRFLRSFVVARPWPIDVSVSDAKAAWSIGPAPPIESAKIDVQFLLPPTVTQKWIEAPNPNQVRTNESIVEFALDSDSSIAIRSRIEIRTSGRIRLRVQHAARLDDNFPWQRISGDAVRNGLAQVTDQLQYAQSEQASLQSLSYRASAGEKQSLKSRRELIDSVVPRLQRLKSRLNKFDQLLSQLSNTAELTISITVQWPAGSSLPQQTIFAMNAAGP